MNIYIFGTQSFKKDIQDELKRSMIDYKLGENGLIQEVKSMSTLKELIFDHTQEDVFLIDDSKIVDENLINTKIKFLKPKDSIERSFLLEQGIEDFSVDSIEGISTHIINKMNDLGLDESMDEQDEIHNSIAEIVNDAYAKELDQNENSEDETVSKNENEDDSIDYVLDDDLKDLLSTNKLGPEEEPLSSDKFGIQDYVVENDKNLDLENKDYEIRRDEEVDNMASLYDENSEMRSLEDITSLDELSESDIISALNGEEISATTAKKIENKAKEMSIKLDNPDDIKEFLAKLLESKALEITVKIKE